MGCACCKTLAQSRQFGGLARAAATYVMAAAWPAAARHAAADSYTNDKVFETPGKIKRLWPWAITLFKPTTPRRNLIKAGAMIIAEIGRIDRAKRGK